MKTVLMSLFAGQRWRCRHRIQGHGGRLGGRGRKERVELAARVTRTYTLPHVKQLASRNLLCDSGNSNQGSVAKERGRKGREVEGRFERKGTYGYLASIHVDVWQEPTQYCKVTVLPLKINRLKNVSLFSM